VEKPNLVVLAGPNGAGKTTAAAKFLVGALQVEEFVNADVIARGISSFRPESVAIQAGRIMLGRLRQLTGRRANVAFESTLASRSFAPMIHELKPSGYQFHLLFLWLPSADAAVNRVRERVSLGGHSVPEDVIRRRYEAGLSNFFRIYAPIATMWSFFDSSVPGGPRLLAEGSFRETILVRDAELWNDIRGKWQ
jgi:predicted ABC-type ATPase